MSREIELSEAPAWLGCGAMDLRRVSDRKGIKLRITDVESLKRPCVTLEGYGYKHRGASRLDHLRI
jgi:hypothetical protein